MKIFTIPDGLIENFDEVETRRKLMELYGDPEMPYAGVSENGETVLISISKDSIVTRTYQSNGWIRINEYDKDGYCIAESYEK